MPTQSNQVVASDLNSLSHLGDHRLPSGMNKDEKFQSPFPLFGFELEDSKDMGGNECLKPIITLKITLVLLKGLSSEKKDLIRVAWETIETKAP